jgi:hypothetical protein
MNAGETPSTVADHSVIEERQLRMRISQWICRLASISCSVLSLIRFWDSFLLY